MNRRFGLLVCTLAILPFASAAQPAGESGPYSVIQRAKVGGDGGFDYVFADSDARRLYINRRGMPAHITVWNLDTLAPAGDVPDVNGHGVVVDPKTNHGFTSSKPFVMFDSKARLLRSPSRPGTRRWVSCSMSIREHVLTTPCAEPRPSTPILMKKRLRRAALRAADAAWVEAHKSAA